MRNNMHERQNSVHLPAVYRGGSVSRSEATRYQGRDHMPRNNIYPYGVATSTILTEPPLTKLVFVWLSMPPLLYLASRGQFWFQDPSSNQAVLDLSGVTTVDSGVERTLITGIIYALLVIVCFRWFRKRRGISGRGNLFIALAVLAIVSSTWSQFPGVTLKSSLYLAANTVLAILLYRRFNPLQQLRLFYLVGWICLVFSYILCLFFPRYGLDPMATLGFGHAWRGIYGYKNACAMMTMFLLPAGIYLPTSK